MVCIDTHLLALTFFGHPNGPIDDETGIIAVFFLQKLIEIEEYVQMSNQSYLIGFYLNSFKVNCLSVSNLSPFFRYQINARHAHSLNIKKNAG